MGLVGKGKRRKGEEGKDGRRRRRRTRHDKTTLNQTYHHIITHHCTPLYLTEHAITLHLTSIPSHHSSSYLHYPFHSSPFPNFRISKSQKQKRMNRSTKRPPRACGPSCAVWGDSVRAASGRSVSDWTHVLLDREILGGRGWGF